MRTLVLGVLGASVGAAAAWAQVVDFGDGKANPYQQGPGGVVILARFTAPPAACNATSQNWLALTGRGQLCTCTGTAWQTVGTPKAEVCTWR